MSSSRNLRISSNIFFRRKWCDRSYHAHYFNVSLKNLSNTLISLTFFSPSASMVEKELPSEYYKAEQLGNKGDCKKYEKYCNLNLLSLFSTIII